MIAKDILNKNPKEKIIYNLTCTKAVPEIIKENSGTPIIEKVGHSFIKDTMKKTGAIFAGEPSGHYYYRDNFRADSAIITSLIILEMLSLSGEKMSKLTKHFNRYHQIEETNFVVKDKTKKLKALEKKYNKGKKSKLDGLTIEFKDWWLNVRPSNTEPVLRLNLEANTKKLMNEKKKELSIFLKK